MCRVDPIIRSSPYDVVASKFELVDRYLQSQSVRNRASIGRLQHTLLYVAEYISPSSAMVSYSRMLEANDEMLPDDGVIERNSEYILKKTYSYNDWRLCCSSRPLLVQRRGQYIAYVGSASVSRLEAR